MPKEKYFYYCIVGDKFFFPKYSEFSGYDFYTMFGLTDKGRIIIFDIPLEHIEEMTLQFFISFMEKSFEIFPSLGYFSRIPDVNNGYYATKKFIYKTRPKENHNI